MILSRDNDNWSAWPRARTCVSSTNRRLFATGPPGTPCCPPAASYMENDGNERDDLKMYRGTSFPRVMEGNGDHYRMRSYSARHRLAPPCWGFWVTESGSFLSSCHQPSCGCLEASWSFSDYLSLIFSGLRNQVTGFIRIMSEIRKDSGWMAEWKDGNKMHELSEWDLWCLF